jgi:hypothetical protein
MRVKFTLLLFLLFPCMGYSLGAANGFCETGNQKVVSGGLNSSTNVQRSFPQCVITVYGAGTVTLATIYSDNGTVPTPLSNPFTANLNGSWTFFTNNGQYDIVRSGAGIPSPITLPSVTIYDPSTGPVFDCSTPRYIGANAGAKIASCIAALPSTGGTADARNFRGNQNITQNIFASANGPVNLLLGAAVFTTTVEQRVAFSGTTIVGLGEAVTVLEFNPSGTANLILWKALSSVTIGYGQITGLTLDAVVNTSRVKTAINVVDAEELVISHVAISNWHDTTNASTGMQLGGRQTFDVHDITDFADKPFHIVADPNNNIVQMDHSHFYNIYACNCINGSAVSINPIWIVDSGVWLTNNTWDGYQAWVGGTYGFYYLSSGELVTSYNNSINNCRTEQSTNAAGYTIFWSPGNISTFNTTVRNCYAAASVNQNGYYFRNSIGGVKLLDNLYSRTGVALNVDTSVSIKASGNFFDINAGATIVTGGSVFIDWDYNDATASNTQVPRLGLGVANPVNSIALVDNNALASTIASGVEKKIIRISNTNDHVEIDGDAQNAYTGGTLSLAGDRTTNGNPLVIANEKWLAANDGTNPKGMVKIDSSGRVTLGEDPNKDAVFNPSVIRMGGANGSQIVRGAGNPNGVVTGNVGDVYLNESGGANTTIWGKATGNGTNTGWLALLDGSNAVSAVVTVRNAAGSGTCTMTFTLGLLTSTTC